MPHTHITRAHLKGYRNIQDTEATFRDGLNIIIGPNGCGKTNFLWLLANRHEETTKDLKISTYIDMIAPKIDDKTYQEIVRHIRNPFKLNGKVEKKIFIVGHGEIDGEYGNDDGHTIYQIVFSGSILLLAFNTPAEIETFTKPFTLVASDEDDRGVFYPKTENSVLSNMIYKKFVNTSNEEMSIKYNPTRTDNHDEKEIIYNKNYFNFDTSIIKDLADYTPIKNVRIKYPLSDSEIIIQDSEIKVPNLFYEFYTNEDWFEWSELSDGTRRIVWLVLNILTTNRDVILIEEPELGIHPHQLAKLMQFIKEQSETKQFIITTHSPEVLNVIESDELDRIKIARYDTERKTTVIENIPEKRQKLIQKHLAKTGQLSDYWVHVNLEGTHKWTK
jgi:energy-coupling factor transporter ATP-binding protein EcfA2